MQATTIDFENDLNPEQLAAVQAPDGPVLIIAAAGTGKTRALTYRVAYLVSQGIDPSRILLLTFTNKAAKEMLERGRTLVGPSVSGLWGGTFHHLCNRILRRHAEVLDYRLDFTILDQDDSRSLYKNIVTELGLKDKQFPKPDVLMSLYSFARNTEWDIEEIVEERYAEHPVPVEDILLVYKHYEQRKRNLVAMDFDDLLLNTLALFEKSPAVLEQYQERFLHVLVDEYQDTNAIQTKLVDLLAGKHRNLLVVGDDFQSIYSWRGADFQNIIDFPKRYPDCKFFKLETNYRSVPEILNVANNCIQGNPEQFQKELRAVREPLFKPVMLGLQDGQQQADTIIRQVQALQNEGYQLSDMAILYRAHFNAMELQLELTRRQIPYIITSGVRFFEQAHIKDVCSILRLLHSPHDELAFQRLMGFLPRVGPKTAQKIWRSLGGRFEAADPAVRGNLAAALPKEARIQWTPIHNLLDTVVEKELLADPAEVLHLFHKDFYDRYALDTFDNHARRVEDIHEVINYASQFESVESFLSEVALVTNLDTEEMQEEEEQKDGLRLSTIHQAKGLEWKVVFILWLADGIFPSGRSMGEIGGEEEERRLFYVAVTRAEDILFLCSPQMRRQRDGGMVFYTPSRFLTELPEGSVDKVG